MIGQSIQGKGANTCTIKASSGFNFGLFSSFTSGTIVKSNGPTPSQTLVTSLNWSYPNSMYIGTYLISFGTNEGDQVSCLYSFSCGTLTALSNSPNSFGPISLTVSGGTLNFYCGIPAGYTWKFQYNIFRLL